MKVIYDHTYECGDRYRIVTIQYDGIIYVEKWTNFEGWVAAANWEALSIYEDYILVTEP
jgi:hypothetical protein